jgi:phosphoglycolate phosphatase
MRRYQGILFDFDYTLADSSVGVHTCINHALAALGLPQVEKSRSDRTIGLNLAETFRVLTGVTDAGQADRFNQYFLEKADDVMVDMTDMLPCAFDAIPLLTEH